MRRSSPPPPPSTTWRLLIFIVDSLDGAELDHCYASFAEQKEKGGKMCCSAIRERMKKSL